MDVTLLRTSGTDHGTLGIFMLPDGWTCRTIELPWRENRTNVSCIPEGSYQCDLVNSGKFGRVYHVQAVPGRSGILIHSGNLAGDTALGFRTHSHGCILPGTYDGRLGDQRAVLASRPALAEFQRRMAGVPFRLHVERIFR